MVNRPSRASEKKESEKNGFQSRAPAIALPKGGGAIRGIGEKFAANPVTGTGSMTVPIATSPGRSGFGPQLSLSYDSGAGNGPFGFGWSLVSRDHPQDRQRTAQISGRRRIGCLHPLRRRGSGAGAGSERRHMGARGAAAAHGRRPHLSHPALPPAHRRTLRPHRALDQRRPTPRDSFWRSISKDNITTWYGKTPESRIADPADPTRIFSWLICESYDDKGNAIVYDYEEENSDGVDMSHAHETQPHARKPLGQPLPQAHPVRQPRRPYLPDLWEPLDPADAAR